MDRNYIAAILLGCFMTNHLHARGSAPSLLDLDAMIANSILGGNRLADAISFDEMRRDLEQAEAQKRAEAAKLEKELVDANGNIADPDAEGSGDDKKIVDETGGVS